MGLLEKAYRSPLGRVMSACARLLFLPQQPMMLYGMKDPRSGLFRKYVRTSSTATIVERKNLSIADHVWIWHHSILDASGGLEIGEGCQIGAWVGVFTHGSHNSIRLLGSRFVDVRNVDRPGYQRAAVKIGSYTFISSGAMILPGVTIGRGCIIGPNSLVMNDVPDYSVLITPPARTISTTLRTDSELLVTQDFSATYYAPELLPQLREMAAEHTKR